MSLCKKQLLILFFLVWAPFGVFAQSQKNNLSIIDKISIEIYCFFGFCGGEEGGSDPVVNNENQFSGNNQSEGAEQESIEGSVQESEQSAFDVSFADPESEIIYINQQGSVSIDEDYVHELIHQHEGEFASNHSHDGGTDHQHNLEEVNDNDLLLNKLIEDMGQRIDDLEDRPTTTRVIRRASPQGGDSDNQTLSFNPSTNILSISNENSIDLSGLSGFSSSSNIFGQTLNITGTSTLSGPANLNGTTTIANLNLGTLSAGTSTDSILVRDSSTGQIKEVAAAVFGAASSTDELITSATFSSTTNTASITEGGVVSNFIIDALTNLRLLGTTIADIITATTGNFTNLNATTTNITGDLTVAGDSTLATTTITDLTTTNLTATTSNIIGNQNIGGTQNVTGTSTFATTTISNLILTGSIDLPADSVSGSNIVDETITAADLATSSVTGTEITDNTITGVDIATDTIASTSIATGAITSDEILDGTITGIDIAADNSIASTSLATGSVGSGEIINGSITAADLADGVASTTDEFNTAVAFASTSNTASVTDGGGVLSFIIDGLTDLRLLGTTIADIITATTGNFTNLNATTTNITGDLTVVGGSTLATTSVTDLAATNSNITGTSTAGNLRVTGNSNLATTTVTGPLTLSDSLDLGLTDGSIIFDGVNGLTEDNANLFWNDTNNRLGIGTNAPGQKLEVDGNIAVRADGLFTNNAGEAVSLSNTDTSLALQTAGLNRLTVDVDGDVGIGTTAPAAQLHVSTVGTDSPTPSFSADDIIAERMNADAGISIFADRARQSSLFFGDQDSPEIGQIRYDHANDELNFFTNTSQHVIIDSSGNVGIGDLTPEEALDVVGTIQSSALLGGATTLTTDANGNIIRNPSDINLKENVETLDNAIDSILELRGVRYEWKDKDRFGDQIEIGFIAQEVSEVLPEVVRKDGEYWSLNTQNILGTMVEAFKELYADVQDYFDRTERLEDEVRSLRAELQGIKSEVEKNNSYWAGSEDEVFWDRDENNDEEEFSEEENSEETGVSEDFNEASQGDNENNEESPEPQQTEPETEQVVIE